MTPAARWAAAAEILDRVQAGDPAEKALTGWARRHRFAGSKDRAAIRDHVFDVLRRRASAAAFGGGETGRALVLGYLRDMGTDPDTVFSGEGHAMPPLTDEERQAGTTPTGAAALDCPDWLEADLRQDLGPEFEPILQRFRHRAPLYLRVNARRGAPETAIERLAQDGIATEPHPLSPSALQVTENPRRVAQSTVYRDGLVEIQDAASQAAADLVPLHPGDRVLDFCAGGGGKTLALGARHDGRLFAHDALPQRMKDLPDRAQRAGISVTRVDGADLDAHKPYDVVLADVPCSGSGAWRRQPEAKWNLDEARLAELTKLQADILSQAAALADRTLVYMTCSLLGAENEAQIDHFLRNSSEFDRAEQHRISPLEGGDGFFVAIIHRRGRV